VELAGREACASSAPSNLIARFLWSAIVPYGHWSLAGDVLLTAGLVRTVAVSPSPPNVAVLGIVVAVRTFLSFSLQVRIEGTVPSHVPTEGSTKSSGKAAQPDLVS
jgi:hypothetical protein